MKPRFVATGLAILALLLSGCGKKSDQPALPPPNAVTPNAAQQVPTPVQEGAPQPPPLPPPVVIPAGTVLTVSLLQQVGSKTSHEGEKGSPFQYLTDRSPQNPIGPLTERRANGAGQPLC